MVGVRSGRLRGRGMNRIGRLYHSPRPCRRRRPRRPRVGRRLRRVGSLCLWRATSRAAEYGVPPPPRLATYGISSLGAPPPPLECAGKGAAYLAALFGLSPKLLGGAGGGGISRPHTTHRSLAHPAPHTPSRERTSRGASPALAFAAVGRMRLPLRLDGA